MGIAPVRRVVEERDSLLAERDLLAAQVRDLRARNGAREGPLAEGRREAAPVVQILNAIEQTVPPTATPRYEAWFQKTFGVYGQAPNTQPATSWTPTEPWGARVNDRMVEIEETYAEALLQEIEIRAVPGAIVEFGVFRGAWLLRLITACERLGMHRQVVGLDSFAGLPAPSAEHDLDCWTEGDYAASLEEVAERLEVARRTNVMLVKGWFSASLPTPAVQAVREIALARIDCDLYAPAVECLDYLAGRLADRSILVFDDWTFDLAKGETRAFAEWLPRVPQYRFEFLCFNSIGHLYMRVHRAA